MRFFSSIIAGAALLASVLALEINEAPSNAEVGKTYTIKYSPADNTPTTFILRVGDSGNLDTVTTLTTTATGGTFQWTVDSSLPNDDSYALEIRQPGATPNFLGPFTISGSSASSRVSSSSAASTTSSASASRSASASTTESASESSSASDSESSTLATVTASGNGTVSLPTLSTGSSGTARVTATRTGSATTGPGAPQNTGAANVLSRSPVALVMGAVAALAYLN